MKIYIINQNFQDKRRKHMQLLMQSLQIPRETYKFVEPLPKSEGARNATAGQVSHYWTYWEILKFVVRDLSAGHENVLILEDDLLPIYTQEVTRVELQRLLSSNAAHQFDALYLETCHNNCKLMTDEFNTHRGQCAGFVAYSNKDSMLRLIQELQVDREENGVRAYDEVVQDIVKSGRWRPIMSVPLFYQGLEIFGSYIEGSSVRSRVVCSSWPSSAKFENLKPFMLDVADGYVFPKKRRCFSNYGTLVVCLCVVIVLVVMMYKFQNRKVLV